MILVHANSDNATEVQLDQAAKLHRLWRESGFLPRNSTLQVDEVTGYITMVFDHCAHGAAYDPWTTVQINVDAEGRYQLWSRKSGWSRWDHTGL